MVRSLLDHGHERIGLIHYGTGVEYEFIERLRGVYAELGDNDIDAAEEIKVDLHNFSSLTPYEASARILSKISQFSAIVTISDFIALALYEVSAQAGIKIPSDLSVISLDDLPFSRYLWPPLTTVHQPVEEIGIKLADVATKYLKGIRVHYSTKILPKLILRESVKDII